MKKILLPIVVAFFAIIATVNVATAQSWISQGWGIGAAGGIGFAVGDISSSMSDAKGHFTFSVQKELVQYLDLKGNFVFGSLQGHKDKYNNGTEANLRFESKYFAYNGMLKFRLTDCIVANDEAKFSTYLQAGIGFIHFNSSLYHKTKIRNKEIETEIAKPGKTVELDFPLGIGFEYRFTPAFSAALDLSAHITNSEKLDVTPNGIFKDMVFTPSIGVNYVFGKARKVSQVPYQQGYTESVPPVVEEGVVEIEEEIVEAPVVTENANTTQVAEATETFDDFDFDFNDEPATTEPATTTTTAPTTITPETTSTQGASPTEDFDFDFTEEPATPVTAVATQPQDDIIAVRPGETKAGRTSKEGLVYRIQIAAYQQYNANMAMSLKNKYALPQMPFEEINGGYYKYTIGAHRTLDEAMAAREAFIAKGVADAFIVPYYVGKRISNQEARDLLQQ